MLDGPHPRPGRRAASGGGLALLIATAADTLVPESSPIGQHRPVPRRSRRRAPREPQRAMQLVMSALGALIMAGICGLSGFFVIADKRHGAQAAEPAQVAPVAARDISSRAVDPEPLQADEAFGQREIAVVPGAAPYVVQMRHIDNDCHIATSGSLGDLLDFYGCTQVVRATMIAPVEGYPITAGIFNLADAHGADAASAQIKSIVDDDLGSFAGMVVGPGTEPVGVPTTQVSWHTRGHFLVYCVVARPDSEIVRDDDPYAQRIVFDVIESYLRDTVIGNRTVVSGD